MTTAARPAALALRLAESSAAWRARAFWRVKGRILLLAFATFAALC